jgi:hypothetical protein
MITRLAAACQSGCRLQAKRQSGTMCILCVHRMHILHRVLVAICAHYMDTLHQVSTDSVHSVHRKAVFFITLPACLYTITGFCTFCYIYAAYSALLL